MVSGRNYRCPKPHISRAVLRGQQPGSPADAPFPEVTDVAHAEIIRTLDRDAFDRGKVLYNTVCFACHGIDGRKTIHRIPER